MKTNESSAAKIDELLLGDEHSITQNFILWSMYDWSEKGKEWCTSGKWFKSVIDYIVSPYLQKDNSVLEIGCGAGFWSEELAKQANSLHLVDIVPSCIELSKERLANYPNVNYHLTEGDTLEFLEDKSINLIFSWNTFVHINEDDTLIYLKEMMRVLAPDGHAIIHHPAIGNTRPELGWRSSVTSSIFKSLSERVGFEVKEQLKSWGEEKEYRLWSNLPIEKCVDMVTILHRKS